MPYKQSCILASELERILREKTNKNETAEKTYEASEMIVPLAWHYFIQS